jgi:hypothetical protein
MAKRTTGKAQVFNEIIARLQEGLDELIAAAKDAPPTSAARRLIDANIREIMASMNDMLRGLDPVRHPDFMFDPGNPAVVGRFIALAMIAQPRAALADVGSFYGSGVYAIYYNGDFPAYASIKGLETPIYVGKADPETDTAKTPVEQGQKLAGRLKDHSRNIKKASSTLMIEDFEYRSLVVQSGWQGAAEDYLIHLFKPVWNNETGICYGLGKHGDDPGTRSNLRSPWDTLHPGRDWAHRDEKMQDARPREQIISDLARHFSTLTVYKNLEQVMTGFMDELRQL